MPQSPEYLLHRAKIPDDLNNEAIKKDIELTAKFPTLKLPKPNHRMGELINLMFDDFNGRMGENGLKVPFVLAKEFDWLNDPNEFDAGKCYSRPSIIKAKKLLGIQSIRRGGKWYWSFPRRAPTELQTKTYKEQLEAFCKLNNEHRRRINSFQTPSIRELTSLLASYNYDVLGKVALEELTFNRRVILRAKARLGVVSLKRKDGWHWVYPAPAVQDWLADLVAEGPRLASDILDEARRKGWSDDVVHMTRKLLGIRIHIGRDTRYKTVFRSIDSGLGTAS